MQHNVSELRSAIKAAYLLQLRHGPFTEKEFEDKSGLQRASLTELLKSGDLEAQGGGNEKRFSLTPTGRRKIKVVLAGGVYDVVHLGHLAALTEAKVHGDVLVAVVATDITVEILKGRKPIFPEEDRCALIEGLKPVDRAILGYEDIGMGFEQVLDEVKPDVVAFGYDQETIERSVREIIERHKLNIQMIKLSRYEHEKYLSSSSVRERLAEALR